MIQTYNLILDLRNKIIKKEIKQHLYHNMDDRSKSVNYGINQDEGYYGLKNKGVNRTILDEKNGPEISLIEPVNISIHRSKMSHGTLPAINRSRQNNIENRQQ
jgi:hypothetical protein